MTTGFAAVALSAIALLGFGVAVDRTCHWRAKRKLRREHERAGDKR